VFTEAKDDGSGGDNWSYRSCKAPVKSSPPTNQHPVIFYRPDALPVAKPTVSKHGREKCHIPWTCLPQTHLGTLSLTTNSSWLPWGRFAMPLISLLMPIPLGFPSVSV